MTDADQQWLYFRTDSGWWRNLNGEIQQVGKAAAC